MTLWTMQQVVQRGTGRQLGAKYPGLHLAGKTGTTNNNVDTWFAGIDGREVVITWVGRDNNQPTKLYGASGAMSIYQRYLANQSPVPLTLTPPEDIVNMGVDESGNFVCGGGMRSVPVWTANPDSLCQAPVPEPTGNPFEQSSPQQPHLSSNRSSSNNSRSSRMRRKTATVSQAGSRICSAVINHQSLSCGRGTFHLNSTSLQQ